MVLRVEAATLRAAERLIADHARGTLEEVLAGLVGDMAEAWERPGSWEARAVCGWLGSHPWPTPSVNDQDEEGGVR